MPDNELQKVHNLLLSITGDNDKLPKAILQQCIKGSLQQTTLSNFQQTFWSGISQRTQTRSYPCSQYNRFHCNAIFNGVNDNTVLFRTPQGNTQMGIDV